MKLARVKAVLVPEFYHAERQWNMLVLSDIQFASDDWKEWKAWEIEPLRKKEIEQKLQAQENKIQASHKAEEERKARELAEEESKWRTWKDGTGKYKIEAKFGGVIGNKVKLIKRDKSSITVPLDKLSKEDQDLIKKRK